MKGIPTVSMIAIVLWGAAVLAPRTSAQGTTQADLRASGQTLTDESLKQMLDGLGYEPKKLSKGYLIALKKDTWTYNMQLVLSPDKTRLGFNANLGSVETPAEVTADQWRTLLEKNGDIDPSFFYFDASNKKVYLHRVLDNRAITPAYIRQQVDNFCANIKDTADAWKFTK